MPCSTIVPFRLCACGGVALERIEEDREQNMISTYLTRADIEDNQVSDDEIDGLLLISLTSSRISTPCACTVRQRTVM